MPLCGINFDLILRNFGLFFLTILTIRSSSHKYIEGLYLELISIKRNRGKEIRWPEYFLSINIESWVNVKKAAEYADVSERTMRSWMKEGLKYSKLPSGMVRIKYSAIDEFLNAFQVDERKKIDAIVDEVLRGLKS